MPSVAAYRVARALRATGSVVYMSSSGAEVLAQIEQGWLPSALVVSTRTEELNAGDLLAELSRLPAAADLPTLLLAESEHASSLFAAALERAGTPVVRAPVDYSELLTIVEYVQGRCGARPQGETKLAGVATVSVAPALDG